MTIQEKSNFTKRKKAALSKLPKRGFAVMVHTLYPHIKEMDVYDVTASKSYKIEVLEALEALAKKLTIK